MVRLTAARLRALAARLEKGVSWVITGRIPPASCAHGEKYREWLAVVRELDAAEAATAPDVRHVYVEMSIPRADGGGGEVFTR
jgi:hypothetical protein